MADITNVKSVAAEHRILYEDEDFLKLFVAHAKVVPWIKGNDPLFNFDNPDSRENPGFCLWWHSSPTTEGKIKGGFKTFKEKYGQKFSALGGKAVSNQYCRLTCCNYFNYMIFFVLQYGQFLAHNRIDTLTSKSDREAWAARELRENSNGYGPFYRANTDPVNVKVGYHLLPCHWSTESALIAAAGIHCWRCHGHELQVVA